MEKKKVLPPTYFILFLIALVITHFILPIIRFIHFPMNLIGFIPLVIGIVFNLVADQAFKRLGTTVKPYERSTTLLTDGIFRVCRHPMYLGMVLILLGISIFLGSLTPFLVTVGFAIIMETVFIKVEEQMMEDTFGSEYIEYKKKVRKWI